MVEGVTFLVKFLGKEVVEKDSEEEETAAAIKDHHHGICIHLKIFIIEFLIR